MKIVQAFLFFASTYFNYQTPDCKSIKNGTFKIVDDNTGTWIIQRQGNLQTEENTQLGIKYSFEVKWTGDCTYLLKNARQLKGQSAFNYPADGVVTSEVLSISEKSYKVRVSSNMNEMVLERDIYFIK